MADFTMPSLGADMEAGTLVEWKVKPGDVVKRGDIVAVVETQKGAIDVEIFEGGRVEELLVKPGTAVPVGTVLARLDGAARAPAPAPAAPEPRVARTSPAPGPAPAEPEPRVRASPAAKAAARELGVDLAKVAGTGPGGAVTRADVEGARGGGKAPASAPARPAMRQAIAAAMSRSKREIPHFYLSHRVDAQAAVDWIARRNDGRPPAERMLPVVAFLKAIALAVRRVPDVNGLFEGGELRRSTAVHLGVVISLREGGVLVPALHDVAEKPIDVLWRELSDLTERARRGQLRSSELSDATLTVSSLGERGVEAVFGVIFPPQVALVGVGKVVDTPWVIDRQCVPRATLTLTLAADHRVTDGHEGALFLAEVDALLQRPEAL